jgi:hypothetical protein
VAVGKCLGWAMTGSCEGGGMNHGITNWAWHVGHDRWHARVGACHNGDTGYGLRDTGYGIRDTGYGIRDYGIRVTGYGIGGWKCTYPLSFNFSHSQDSRSFSLSFHRSSQIFGCGPTPLLSAPSKNLKGVTTLLPTLQVIDTKTY